MIPFRVGLGRSLHSLKEPLVKKVYSDTGIKGEDSGLSETGEELELLHKVRWMASPADRPTPSLPHTLFPSYHHYY